MKYISLDIETVPLGITDDYVKDYLMDKKIPKEARSLDPNYSRIVVIGVKPFNESTKIFTNENEKILLEEFWDFMKDYKYSVIVTHNGYKFDVPFLKVRSCINDVKIPFPINTNKWNMENSNHFDVMLFFSHYETFLNQNLYILGKMHNLEVPNNRIFGAEIERLYNQGDIESIKKKCKQDVEILEKIFEKLCLNYLKSISLR